MDGFILSVIGLTVFIFAGCGGFIIINNGLDRISIADYCPSFESDLMRIRLIRLKGRLMVLSGVLLLVALLLGMGVCVTAISNNTKITKVSVHTTD